MAFQAFRRLLGVRLQAYFFSGLFCVFRSQILVCRSVFALQPMFILVAFGVAHMTDLAFTDPFLFISIILILAYNAKEKIKIRAMANIYPFLLKLKSSIAFWAASSAFLAKDLPSLTTESTSSSENE